MFLWIGRINWDVEHPDCLSDMIDKPMASSTEFLVQTINLQLIEYLFLSGMAEDEAERSHKMRKKIGD